MKKALVILALIMSPTLFAINYLAPVAAEVVAIPAIEQKAGDAEKGYQYLTTGNYIKSGVPYKLFIRANGTNTANLLNRTGRNATVMHQYNVVRSNGADMVVPTCMQCHSQLFDGKLVIGLGNTFLDFSNTKSINVNTARSMVKLMYPRGYRQSRDFMNAFTATFPQMQTEVRGVNTAVKLAIVLAAHRDPQTLKWSRKPLNDIPEEVYPVDVPAWWQLKKKNAMFHNGFARGDQSKFLMLANLLTVKDTAEAREVSSHFRDVLAYIRTVTPPAYPKHIDKEKAAKGLLVFDANCSRCHGSYGANGQYPNLLIPLSIVKTDSVLCQGVAENAPLVSWFEKSWFAQGENAPYIMPFNGYIAPPLDGVWITAPYLHNGSVPTLEALLNSKERPRYWSRDFVNGEYDYDAVGWKYTLANAPKRRVVYNTTLRGYTNGGHYFGDKLSKEERGAVIEYLKTL
jgi:mono/diheme cytochrome c family protein